MTLDTTEFHLLYFQIFLIQTDINRNTGFKTFKLKKESIYKVWFI